MNPIEQDMHTKPLLSQVSQLGRLSEHKWQIPDLRKYPVRQLAQLLYKENPSKQSVQDEPELQSKQFDIDIKQGVQILLEAI